ncbi:MAG: hypothetical protein QNK27_05155, partial [Desulfuromusa sp.]|nr:hypothetical protein [Desulfuromusa sp.]
GSCVLSRRSRGILRGGCMRIRGLATGRGAMAAGGRVVGGIGSGALSRCSRRILGGGSERGGCPMISRGALAHGGGPMNGSRILPGGVGCGGRAAFGGLGRCRWVFRQRRLALAVTAGGGGGYARIKLAYSRIFRCWALRRTEDNGKGPQDNYHDGDAADDARGRKFPELESLGVFFHGCSVFDIVRAGCSSPPVSV